MTIAELKDWWAVIAGAGGVLAVVLVLWLSTKFVPRTEFARWREHYEREMRIVADRLNRGEAHFARIEALLQPLSGMVNDVHQLRVENETTRGTVATLAAVVDGVRELVGRAEATVVRHEQLFAEAARRE